MLLKNVKKVQKCPKMSKKVQKCPKMPNVQKCPKKTKNVQKRPKMSIKCPKESKNVQKCQHQVWGDLMRASVAASSLDDMLTFIFYQQKTFENRIVKQ